MTTIAQGAIVAKFVEILAAADLATVQRSRRRAMPDTVRKMIVVRKTDSDPTAPPNTGAGAVYSTLVRVECLARGRVAEASDEAADELLALAHAAIVANPTLDGLAIAVDPPRLAWEDGDEFDQPLGVSIAQYTVTHRTAPNSLEADT